MDPYYKIQLQNFYFCNQPNIVIIPIITYTKIDITRPTMTRKEELYF